tara:strand:+ start:4006 stop:4185 length:180 start_codon:yes stop_codon:yes gene_type:complete
MAGRIQNRNKYEAQRLYEESNLSRNEVQMVTGYTVKPDETRENFEGKGMPKINKKGWIR